MIALRASSIKIWALWNDFWFNSPAPARLRLFRTALASMLFVFYSLRSLELRLYFSESGIMPLSIVPEVLPMDFRKSVFFFFSSDAAILVGNAVFLGALALLALGVVPRLFAILALLLHVSFLHRNMAPAYGADMISCFFLFFLCMADYTGQPKPDSVRAMVASMAARFIQLQVCIIYAYAGLEKVKGPQWWSGEALWGVVSNVQLARWDFSFLAHMPLILVIATYSTLIWEIYFPVLIWVKPLRKFMLLFGVALHLGIGLMVNIPFFAALMIIGYILFLDEGQAERVVRRLRLR